MDERLTGVVPADVVERLDHLEHLSSGWDSCGAVPPTPWALAVARGTIRQLAEHDAWALAEVFIVPAIDGGIRLEWVRDDSRELTLIIPPNEDGAVEFYRFDPVPPYEDHVVARDLSRLPTMLAWYRGR
jgi:hypothetical protein